jgi:hypothetical protein
MRIEQDVGFKSPPPHTHTHTTPATANRQAPEDEIPPDSVFTASASAFCGGGEGGAKCQLVS